VNVVLLHGLHAGPAQLTALALHLRAQGHVAVLLDLATTRGLDACVLDAWAQQHAAFPTGPVHVVGFSFGSLVARALAHRLGERCPLLVQIAPPNQGAGWARRFSAVAMFHAGVRDLTPGSAALARLPVPGCPIAIVAGTTKIGWSAPITWPVAFANAALRIDEPGDGTVTLAETALPPGAAELDRVLLPYAHDHLPAVKELHAQVAHVLQHGRFKQR